MDKDQIIIEANNLSAGYGDKLIWKDASFQVKKGEFVGVLGPNGAGKTTLFKLFLGLQKPISGGLKLFNESPKKGNPKIGYVPQSRLIDDEFNLEVLELVRLGVKNLGWGFALPNQARHERKAALKILEQVGALDLAHMPLGKLSGGEMQRVFLAQALVGQPDLLLLDEPLANLDIRREAELINLIKKVSVEQNVTVLLIAHDINPLLKSVDKLIYSVSGRIATGKVNEIITSDKLSQLYGANIEVLKDSRGRLAVLGTEEVAHHE
jgi:zinc/manganese transport system ATP-binding protein